MRENKDEREQKIEEMARVMCPMTHSEGKCDCKLPDKRCSEKYYAKKLYNAGYRKQVHTGELEHVFTLSNFFWDYM